MRIAKKVATVAITGALLLGGGMVPAAFAGGAGGGDFNCWVTGIPNWGYVHSEYNHLDKKHYATAIGTGRQTVTQPAGTWAKAETGRASWGDHCYWGTD